MNGFKRSLLGVALAACLALTAVPYAHAEGTGDDPRRTQDVVRPDDAAAKAADDARFESWKKSRDKAEKKDRTREASEGVGALSTAMDGGYTYLWTPSHPQERSYWCGPATCQIIAHHFGRLYSQTYIARWLGTTSAGTDFTRVDDCLRALSGQSYWYTGGVSNFNIFMDMCEFGIGIKKYPSVADVRIYASVWPNYNLDHNGHIVPIEAFDERSAPYTVRLNDPYSEAAWQSGGGNTFGHQTYPAWVVANGVMNHWRQAMVR